MAAELALIAGFALSIRSLLAFAEIAEMPAVNFLPAPIWWTAVWACLRFSIVIAGLLVVRPTLWFLPIVAALWELKIFAGAVHLATEVMSNYSDVLGDFDFATLFAVFGHFWIACIFPAVVVPILVLQGWWLFAERERRHAV